jgi:hypothetical protein
MKKIGIVLGMVAVLMTGCAPTYRALKKECPTTVMLLGDFVLASAALAASTFAYTDANYPRAVAAGATGMGIAMGAHFAEATCRK